jgi:hypothetical protein
MSEVYQCPLCHSNISKERFDKVTGLWKTIKEQEQQFKKRKEELEKQTKEAFARIKEREDKWKKEKLEIESKYKTQIKEIEKKAEQKALLKVQEKFKKELGEKEKKAREQGKLEQQKKIDILIKNSEKLSKEKVEIEKRYQEALKKGKTIQEMGFDYEKRLKTELEENFPEDKIIKWGQKGDILQIVQYKGNDLSKILYECKNVQKWEDKWVPTLKEAVLFRNSEYGIIVTNALKNGKKGFCSYGEKIFAINPEGIIDFVKFLRQSIIKIKSLKVTQEEKEALMHHLWAYIESNEFRNAINEVIDKTIELKDLLNKEQDVHKRIWDKRIEYYNQINKDSSGIKEKVNDILGVSKKIPLVVGQKSYNSSIEDKKEKIIYFCAGCGREINHKGKCLMCNIKAKKERKKLT